jgi:hypothetical protein
MQSNTAYKAIEPPKKWFKTQITRICLYYLGVGIETAYKNIPAVKKDMDTLPDPFTFCISVANGPSLTILKTGEKVVYVGEKDAFRANLELQFKNIEFAYLAMTARLSTPNAVYHNRQLVKGDLNYMMMMIRVMNAAETILFPNILLRFYLKEVPRLTLRTMINRVKAHTRALIGIYL